MTIQLIDGHFSPKEALNLLTQVVHVKVKFHESMINQSASEEDIKMREQRIKRLQRDLYDLQQYISRNGQGSISLHANLEIDAEVSAVVV